MIGLIQEDFVIFQKKIVLDVAWDFKMLNAVKAPKDNSAGSVMFSVPVFRC